MSYLLDTTRYLASGAMVSVSIFFITLMISLPLSLILFILYRKRKWIKKVIDVYTWFFRGTPLMLQLFFFMYGLPSVGIPVDRMTVALIAFSINYTAYFIEIIRAGVESLPKDQEESASVMGATMMQINVLIIFPQALRRQLPVFTNETITLIKDTALVTVIAISDLLRQVKEVVSRDFTLSPFMLAALFYLGFSFIIVKLMKHLESKWNFLDNAS